MTNDKLGTPRINTDASGNVISRHDYLPFGEELTTAQRAASIGYSTDDINQKFTGKERDEETQLDYFGARYFASKFGRFTSVDPLQASANTAEPQTWNRYAYVGNNPFLYVDDDGKIRLLADGTFNYRAVKIDYYDAPINASNGKYNYLRIDRIQNGYLQTDNTEKVGQIRAYTIDGIAGADYRFQTNCFGLAFTNGEFWLEGDDIPTLLADEYDVIPEGTSPTVGDIAIYVDPANTEVIIHAAVFHYFSLHKAVFLEQYHKRSNVESLILGDEGEIRRTPALANS